MIHETILASGEPRRVHLARGGEGEPLLVTDEGRLALPAGALGAVMRRFGAPLEEREALALVGELALGDEHLRHVRHRARYDVIARDYIVYEAPGRPPQCALATTVAGALEHLARAAGR